MARLTKKGLDALKTKVSGILANAALLLASLLVGLLLCEVGLRLFHPKYAYLADAPFIRDPNLLYMRIPGSRRFIQYPDGRMRPHSVFHNKLGLRQHREFSAEDIENSVNIGFFGDSFTENVRMKAQFSYTEPLDYLLNIGGGGVNVLNFGVGGYGTSQSLLRYEMLDFRETLDHVFYLYCENDLRDNLKHGQFRLDDAGQLARGEAPASRFSLLSKLHLPYLVLDAGGRLSVHLEDLETEAEQLRREGSLRANASNTLAQGRFEVRFSLFRQLLRHWKEAAEGNGASFRLVLLPRDYGALPGIAAIAEEEGVETVSLQDCFSERDPTHLRTPWALSPYRFERDGHWNEAGNRLAAVCLHRVLESALGLPRLSEEEVALALCRYYSAFDAPGSVRECPSHSDGRLAASPQAEAIRRKYAALELEETPAPAERAPRARFDVQLQGGQLAYFKAGCTWADIQDAFFLHVYPADARDLPAHRLEHGFDTLHFLESINKVTCTARRRLPNYAIDRIRTGQFFVDAEGGYHTLWEEEFTATHLKAASEHDL